MALHANYGGRQWLFWPLAERSKGEMGSSKKFSAYPSSDGLSSGLLEEVGVRW